MQGLGLWSVRTTCTYSHGLIRLLLELSEFSKQCHVYIAQHIKIDNKFVHLTTMAWRVTAIN